MTPDPNIVTAEVVEVPKPERPELWIEVCETPTGKGSLPSAHDTSYATPHRQPSTPNGYILVRIPGSTPQPQPAAPGADGLQQVADYLHTAHCPEGANAMIRFKFNLNKAIQATAVLLRHSCRSKSDNYTRVIKLLYMAEKRSMQERGHPITGDKIVAMKNGQVLSRIYDLIMGRDAELLEWQRFIRKEEFDIVLEMDPGVSELSAYEIKLLQSICEEKQNKDQWELIDELHVTPEFQKNDPRNSNKGSKEIPFEDIVAAVESDAGKQAEIKARAEEQIAIEALWSAV